MRLVVAVLLGILGCAAPEPSQPSCGNGACESELGEDLASCVVDCICNSCGPHTTCVYRVCVPVFYDATYQIEIRFGQLPATRTDGSSWDADGLPDPYVTVTHGSTIFGTGPVAEDSVEPAWNSLLPGTIALTRGEQLRLEVYDKDEVDDELMFSCTRDVSDISPVSVAPMFYYACNQESSQARYLLTFWLRAQ